MLTLRGRAEWAHYYETDRALFASFQSLPASGFTVFGAEQARNVALVSAAAETKWRNGFSIAGVFEGEFSDRTHRLRLRETANHMILRSCESIRLDKRNLARQLRNHPHAPL